MLFDVGLDNSSPKSWTVSLFSPHLRRSR